MAYRHHRVDVKASPVRAGAWAAAAGLLVAAATLSSAAAARDWRAVPVPSLGRTLRSIAVAPGAPARVYIGTAEGTVLVSDDGGTTFDEVDLPVPAPRAAQVRRPAVNVSDPNVALLALTSIGAQSLIMRPNPGFMPYMNVPSYKALPLGSWPMGFTVRPQITRPPELINGPYTLFFAASSRFVDSVLDWEMDTRPPRAPVDDVVLCPAAPDLVLARTPGDLLASTDEGRSFAPLFQLPADQRLEGVSCGPAGSIRVETSAGAFVSTDGGATFASVGGGELETEDARRPSSPPQGLEAPTAAPVTRVVSAAGAPGEPPSLWAISDRELVTTAPRAPVSAAARGIQAWAGRRLRSLPPLSVLLADGLARHGLLGGQIRHTLGLWTERNLAPRLDVSYVVNQNGGVSTRQVAITDPLATEGNAGHVDSQLLVTLTWFLPELASPIDAVAGFELGRAERGMNARRQALSNAVSGAYEERRAVLAELAVSPPALLPAFVEASRVEVLDALLAQWTEDSPFQRPDLPPMENP
jgi:hypothetical protein